MDFADIVSKLSNNARRDWALQMEAVERCWCQDARDGTRTTIRRILKEQRELVQDELLAIYADV